MLIAVGSLKGSPGASTLALAMAAVWPDGSADARGPMVVEADCAGGDLGGRCWLPDSPGLASLATGTRAGGVDLGQHTARLACGVEVVVAPASRQAATIAVGLLAEIDPAAWTGDRVVLADVGRLETGLPGVGLAEAADVLLLVSAGDEASLLRVGDAAIPRDRSRLVVVGACSYSAEEVETGVGIPVAGQLPWDPRAAAVLWGQRAPGRGWASRGLPAAARAVALDWRGARPGPMERGGHRARRGQPASTPRVGSST